MGQECGTAWRRCWNGLGPVVRNCKHEPVVWRDAADTREVLTMTRTEKTRARSRAPRWLRRQVACAMAKATGPEAVNVLRNPDGTIVVSLVPVYLWKGRLPNGEPFAFTTETPTLEYAGLIDVFADRLHRGRRGWTVIEHSAACREVGAGCICEPTMVREVNWGEG